MRTNKPPKEKEKVNFTTKLIVGICVFLIFFTAACLWILYEKGVESPTLIISAFGGCLGEFGLAAWIKTTKEQTKLKSESEEKQIEGDRHIDA